MAKVLKDLYITWDWQGDSELLEGFNVAITPQGSNPTDDAIIIQETGKDKTDLLNKGTTQYEHIFRNLTLNDTQGYTAWVQSLVRGDDSEWLSATGVTVSDDGTATIATVASLGDLASEDMVEEAKLGSTIIDGGYIKSDLLTAGNIITGVLDADVANIHANDGDITIDGNGIKTVGSNGDYSLLTDEALAFYKEGATTPHWYSKRVAYGTAQDGDYVELNWDKKPKAQTAIKSLMSYHSAFSENDQVYESYADSITSKGFYVYGKSVIPTTTLNLGSNWSAETDYDYYEREDPTHHRTFEKTYISPYSDTETTNLLFDLYFAIKINNNNEYTVGRYSWNLDIKYEDINGNVSLYDNYEGVFHKLLYYSDYEVINKSINISVPSGEYRIIVNLTLNVKDVYNDNGANNYWGLRGHPYISVTNQQTKSRVVVDNGEVMWIAIEGGAE